MKKVLSLILCLTLLAGVCVMPSNAAKADDSLTGRVTGDYDGIRKFGAGVNKLLQGVAKGVCAMYPAPRTWKSLDEYTGEFVYDEADGRQNYLTEPAEGAKWLLGYSSASIIPEDFAKNKYYMGRQLNVVSFSSVAKADGILDDQRVRVVCMDDNSGGGAIVMAVIDGLGVTSGSIRAIRERLKDYTSSGKIAAVNVSATHTHSAIDTQGVSTSMLYVMAANVLTNLFGMKRASTSNDPFIENMISVTVKCVEEAYKNMEEGTLSYDKAPIGNYVRDKREYVIGGDLPDVGIFRFTPDDPESRGTYLVDFTCHPTNINAKAGMVSSDYVYYMDYVFKKEGYNFAMLQGAVGQISRNADVTPASEEFTLASKELKLEEKLGAELYDETNAESADAFGERMARLVLDARADGEEALRPMLNTRYTYVQFMTSNYILHLACRIRLIDNEIFVTGKGLDDVVLPSEVGYVEMGGRAALGLFPCELYPEVFHGAEVVTDPAGNYSWDKTSWDIPSAHDMVRNGVDVYAVCFANDYIGYVVPDNFYSGLGHWSVKGSDRSSFEYDESKPFLTTYAFQGTADELLSADKSSASKIMKAFEGISRGDH